MTDAAPGFIEWKGSARPDGLIFDLDGTLWDSTGTVARAWSRALRILDGPGREITAEEIAGMMGKTHREIYRAMFPGLEQAEQERRILACYAEEERQLHRTGGNLYPGVEEGLARLSPAYSLFIVSNCQQGYIESFLGWSGLGGLFSDFECHGNTGQDEGDNLKQVRRRNGLRRPVYIGDTQSDQDAALQGGMPFIHAGYGFGKVRSACPRVDSFAALVGMAMAHGGP